MTTAVAHFQFRTLTVLTIVTWSCLLLGVVAIVRAHPLPSGVIFGSLLLTVLVMAIFTHGRRLTIPQIMFVIAIILASVWLSLPRIH